MKNLTLQQLRNIAYPGAPFTYPPSQEELEAKALYFVRTCKPKEYKRLKQSGELEEYCQLKAKAATSYKERITTENYTAPVAWNMAIRLEILESESD